MISIVASSGILGFGDDMERYERIRVILRVPLNDLDGY